MEAGESLELHVPASLSLTAVNKEQGEERGRGDVKVVLFAKVIRTNKIQLKSQ